MNLKGLKKFMSRFYLWVVGMGGTLVVRLIFLTVRIRTEGDEKIFRARGPGAGPFVFALWHGRFLGCAYSQRNQDIHVMISRHHDGEIISRIVERIGYLSIRGSASRGAIAAFKAMLRALEKGHDLAITVDGSRGPAGKVKPGVVFTASRSGCPVVPITAGYSSAFTFPSWDRFQVPKPFCRMVIVVGKPVHIPGKLDDNQVSHWCRVIEDDLDHCTLLADNLSRPIERLGGKLSVYRMAEVFLTRKKNRLWHLPLLALLLPAEGAYRLAWLAREILYSRGILKAVQSPVPAVCVGSLGLGGAGKTPLTMLIAQKLVSRGAKVAILTRGYRGAMERAREPYLIHPGTVRAEELDRVAGLAGDEAALLARKLGSVGIAVCSDRAVGARAAVEQFGAQVLVMDDGFGNRSFGRSMDLVLFGESMLTMTGHVLPAGYLREPRAAAARARAVVLNGSSAAQPENLDAESRNVPWAAGKEIIRLYKTACSLVPLEHWLDDRVGEENRLDPEKTLKGKRVLAFCGIAHPESFRDLVAGLGPGWLKVMAFADHCRYSAEMQQGLAHRAKYDRAEVLVTTEKDAIKLDPKHIGPGCLVVGLEIREVTHGALDRLLDELTGGLSTGETKPDSQGNCIPQYAKRGVTRIIH